MAVKERVLEPEALAGSKEAVTPVGSPVAESVTESLKPFCGVMAILLVRLPPCSTVRLLGEAFKVKLGFRWDVERDPAVPQARQMSSETSAKAVVKKRRKE